ncbi:hypothetical protein [Aeromicrobium chenweiae]|nr:hypothetical protein [Aeromicrobium chenweiae]
MSARRVLGGRYELGEVSAKPGDVEDHRMAPAMSGHADVAAVDC